MALYWETNKLRVHSVLFVLTAILCLGHSIPEEDNSTSQPKSVADGVNEFGYKLLNQMIELDKNNTSNVIISPTGIAGLLAMTLLGSVGGTYEELAKALGFSQDILENRKNHETLGNLLADLSSSKTVYADAIFVDSKTRIRGIYSEYLQRVYHGEALVTNFTDINNAKKDINDWVKNHTMDKIQEFILSPLPIQTKVVLLSALYFSGQWKQPFLTEFTKRMRFHLTSSTHVETDFMLNAGSFNYFLSYQYAAHMLALPYNDLETTMYIIKPLLPRKNTLQSLLKKLDEQILNEMIANMTETKCVIRLPKMTLMSKTNLEDPLKALGLKSLFTGEANFALMIDSNKIANYTETELLDRINTGDVEPRTASHILSRLENPGVYVDSVLHDVKIRVDENGTEAVAATGGFLARTAEQFYADSPFYMFIRNERTKLITFSAAIFDPTLDK